MRMIYIYVYIYRERGARGVMVIVYIYIYREIKELISSLNVGSVLFCFNYGRIEKYVTFSTYVSRGMHHKPSTLTCKPRSVKVSAN